ncbi:hypothetical protein AOL_s00088g57 [Orbilia oligospora ATCC 24927]|uniref:Uncharacterized protein n=1 Tax=Arthrobotrys oligospora (strain ATCC 24927 / CBS 115.81 / DSM 1491) TaxID=756982 RepID=G1XHU4_ARTOA|nr:hypothetical protein AOL_s00088g57 [Orbilia oligospora ATCC 24927]EGX47281.1 hypothetical protein AOL_s00088g57 [Orbilia oligospora ATCC 24927]
MGPLAAKSMTKMGLTPLEGLPGGLQSAHRNDRFLRNSGDESANSRANSCRRTVSRQDSGILRVILVKVKGRERGVDAVVFAGGIGEGSPRFRKMIMKRLDDLNGSSDGVDDEKNHGGESREVPIRSVMDSEKFGSWSAKQTRSLRWQKDFLKIIVSGKRQPEPSTDDCGVEAC